MRRALGQSIDGQATVRARRRALRVRLPGRTQRVREPPTLARSRRDGAATYCGTSALRLRVVRALRVVGPRKRPARWAVRAAPGHGRARLPQWDALLSCRRSAACGAWRGDAGPTSACVGREMRVPLRHPGTPVPAVGQCHTRVRGRPTYLRSIESRHLYAATIEEWRSWREPESIHCGEGSCKQLDGPARGRVPARRFDVIPRRARPMRTGTATRGHRCQ